MSRGDRGSVGGCLLAVCAGVALLVSHGPATSASAAPAATSLAQKGALVCRLIADPQNKFTYVPPPAPRALNNRSQLVIPPSVINVTYVNFTDEQKAAFQFAVDIWTTQVGSPVPIEVFAQMTALGAGVLGQAGPSWIYPLSGSFYPIALANKISNTDLKPGPSVPDGGQDIDASFNPNFNWYYGTDGRPGAGQYDFASVVLHELGHGLGFEGSMNSPDGVNGTWGEFGGGQTLPEVYDRFTENAAAVPLLSFASPSTALYAQLTGQAGGVFWNGTHALASNGSVRPKLYAPNPWAPGSSYSHLDETTYPAGNPNSLMTFALGAAEAIHDPGPIVRGVFQDEGWTTDPCSITLSPSSATFPARGGAGSVGVATSAGCAWTAVSSAPDFLKVTGGASGVGNGTVTFSVIGGAPLGLTATITIGDATFTVTQLAPVMALDRTSLAFSATTSGGAFTSVTAPQTVHVTFDVGSPAWFATANQPWVQITRSGANGNPPFVVSVVSVPGLPAAGVVTATITVNAAPVGNSPLTLPVTLNLQAAGASQPPFGFLDTPTDGLAGVTGSIAVTGWALDDVGVTSVGIYRNCLVGIDSPATCQLLGADNVVFIGDASFVAGARPDIEAAFPSYPFAYRAGWGYLMLTNMLPRVTAPTSAAGGGQGPISIFAYATDVENHRVLLGQHTITLDNDHATHPFGSIDTPSQGGTASGVFTNFGWALTPGVAKIPVDGSTIVVVVDGVAIGTATYDQCRDGASPPGGPAACHDDIATLFPGYTNIIGGRGAIGSFNIDTRTLADGAHTIAWSVTDDHGQRDGIGSRFFQVTNGSTVTASQTSAMIAGRSDEAPPTLGTTADIAWRAASDTPISGRIGFDFDTPSETLQADDDGVVRVRIPELGRLELWLGEKTSAGYLHANGTLRPLPAGSVFDAATGQFTWAAGPGFIGTYDLVFLEGASTIAVQVTVAPKASAMPGSIRAYIDTPSANATVSGRFVVAGWAADLEAWHGSGVGAVHVWATRLDVPAAAPAFLGAAQVGLRRPDVGAAMGAQLDRAGWELETSGLEPGKYDITAYLWSIRTGRFEDARSVTVSVR